MNGEKNNQSSHLINYLECELKESKTLEEFKAKFAEIKTIHELSNKANTTDKIDFKQYDEIICHGMIKRFNHIVEELEAFSDTWMDLYQHAAVEPEGSENVGRDLDSKEKEVLGVSQWTIPKDAYIETVLPKEVHGKLDAWLKENHKVQVTTEPNRRITLLDLTAIEKISEEKAEAQNPSA